MSDYLSWHSMIEMEQEFRRQQLAKSGCCSAISPCAHQRANGPDSICEVCAQAKALEESVDASN